MDEVISRDQNFRTVVAGVTQDSARDITMFRVDPVTGYLLAHVVGSSTTDAIERPIAKRDQNFRPVCLGWNEQAQELQEILTDSDGNLLVDIN